MLSAFRHHCCPMVQEANRRHLDARLPGPEERRVEGGYHSDLSIRRSRMSKLFLSAFLILPLLLVACSVAAEPPTLRLATWNLEHLAAAADAGCRPRSEAVHASAPARTALERRSGRVAGRSRTRQQAAVARLFDPGTYAIEIARQPDRNLGTCRRQQGQARTMQRTGFAINRERLAALGRSYRRLPDFAAIGMGSQRWATRVLIEPADGTGDGIQLLAVHLKSGCAYNRLDGKVDRDQCKLLIRQRGILEEWIDARVSAGEGLVLLGDFNRQLDQPRDDFWAAIDDGAVYTWMPDFRLGRRCRPQTSRPDPAADLGAGQRRPALPFSLQSPLSLRHRPHRHGRGDGPMDRPRKLCRAELRGWSPCPLGSPPGSHLPASPATLARTSQPAAHGGDRCDSRHPAVLS